MESYKDPNFSRIIIMDHYENPSCKVESKPSNEYLEFNNNSESCIDNITIYLKINNGVIQDACFSGIGCAISTASSDIFCSILKNKTIENAFSIIDNYFKMINNDVYSEQALLDLNVFSNVHKQANRIKCALISCDAIKNILSGNKNE